jgi:hypothetical protein
MTEVTEEDFLLRLYEVVYKLSGIAKTQSYRFQKIWNNYFSSLDIKPHIVRNIPLEKEKFLEDIDYRIDTLKIIAESQVDGYYSIQSILKACYLHYFPNSDLFKNDFSAEDQIIVEYLASREILGNLVQYNKMDHETVPLKYNVIARDYIMIKLKGIKLTEIISNLKKLNKVVERETLIGIMEQIKADGLINIEQQGDDYFYTLNNELVLSEEGAKKYTQTLRPLIDWPTQFWRSYYNIRELNFTPSKSVKFNDFLITVLSKSATQGFGPANYVFKNLIKYFEKVKETS